MEITKMPIFKLQIFAQGKKVESRIIRVYGIIGKKIPTLDEVKIIVTEALSKNNELVMRV